MHLACNLLSYPRGGFFRAVSRSVRRLVIRTLWYVRSGLWAWVSLNQSANMYLVFLPSASTVVVYPNLPPYPPW